MTGAQTSGPNTRRCEIYTEYQSSTILFTLRVTTLSDPSRWKCRDHRLSMMVQAWSSWSLGLQREVGAGYSQWWTIYLKQYVNSFSNMQQWCTN